MTSLVSRRKHGFSSGPLHNQLEPHPIHFLKQKSSFWIATLSVMAFVIGNMIGQNGWYLFMASVLGSQDDSLIAYTGTVTPLEKIPDYSRWASYGGNAEDHTFRQVPQDALVDLPLYDQNAQIRTRNASSTSSVYSVGHLGSYATGAENSGSHPGVDIRVPIGTPVRAVANGIVEEIKNGGGFGLVVIIRHPNVPDPDRPSRKTTLYSSYAHLQSSLVEKGTVVQKGEHVAYSGDSGFVTGAHLHFQMDRESAPFHPYWPFTDAEARRAGLTTSQAVDVGLNSNRLVQYTVHPMLYVQADLDSAVEEGTLFVEETPKLTRQERLALRIQQRLADHEEDQKQIEEVEETPPTLVSTPVEVVVTPPVVEEVPEVRMSRSQRAALKRDERIQERIQRQRFANRQVARTPTTVVQQTEVASQVVDTSVVEGPVTVKGIEIQHDGTYTGRGWEKVTIHLLDDEGNLIENPNLERDIHLRTAYGEAEFRPAVLSQVDFNRGEAVVYMLPRGRRTIIIQAQPYLNLSKPMAYSRD